jgi:gas vesicle protein
MWEEVVVGASGTVIGGLVTYLIGRKKQNVETKSVEYENFQRMFEIYKNSLEQYKKELKDAHDRLSDYIIESNKRAEISKNKIENLEKSNEDLQRKIQIISKQVCMTENCSLRTSLSSK